MFQVYKWEKAVKTKPKHSQYDNMAFEFRVNEPVLQVTTIETKRREILKVWIYLIF